MTVHNRLLCLTKPLISEFHTIYILYASPLDLHEWHQSQRNIIDPTTIPLPPFHPIPDSLSRTAAAIASNSHHTTEIQST